MNVAAVLAGHGLFGVQISGTVGMGIILAAIGLVLTFLRKRQGWGWEQILLVVGVLVIIFGLLGGNHLHSVHIPGH